jgi:hypothetical protein
MKAMNYILRVLAWLCAAAAVFTDQYLVAIFMALTAIYLRMAAIEEDK